jgi:hypothetical protein
MHVDSPIFDVVRYKNILDKTQIYYKGNREYIELPIYSTHGSRSPDNDYTSIRHLISVFYPVYYNPKFGDPLLKKHYKYKITQSYQSILQYIKDIQKDVEDFIKKDKETYRYNLEEHNLPFRDYTEITKWAYSLIGRDAAKNYLREYKCSNWFFRYTPNAWVDIMKLKAFAKDINVEDCFNELKININIE